jgi:hypothetical protein
MSDLRYIGQKHDTVSYIISAALFLYFIWQDESEKLKEINHRLEWVQTHQVEEIARVFYSLEKSLLLYDYPLSEDDKVYYQHALTTEIMRLEQLTNTLNSVTFYPNSTHDGTLNEVQQVLRNLRGYTYTDEEMDYAKAIVKETGEALDRLVYNEFDIEDEKDRKNLLTILNRFIEKSGPLERK